MMTPNHRMIESSNYRWLVLLALPCLTGCEWIGNKADQLGSYMPVIGERCEHWQCFTEGGRAQSEQNKMIRGQKAQQETAPEKTSAPAEPQGDIETNPWDHYRP